jgi:Pentapeptide repeats (8 copies)
MPTLTDTSLGNRTEMAGGEVKQPLFKNWAAWPRSTRWLIFGIAALVLAAAVSWLLIVPAADWLARHDVGSVRGPLLQTARDAARGRLLTLGAGLFAAGALVFTARNFVLSREGQVTDRYTKAIDQLGSDKLDVRIGGIYALERVARDSAKDSSTVMEVLTAFIRQYSHDQWPKTGPGRWTRPDVQAAITVAGRRAVKHDIKDRPIDLYGAILIRANLNGANLRGATLRGADLTSADLRYAILVDADLRDVTIRGARIGGANLTGARYSESVPAPEGWRLRTGSDRLERQPNGSSG